MTGPNSSRSSSSQASTQANLHRAAWLNDDILLLVGHLVPGAQQDLSVRATVGTRPVSGEAHSLMFKRAGSDEPAGAVIVCRFSSPLATTEREGAQAVIVPPASLTVELGNARACLGSSDAPEATVDLRTLAREELAYLDPDTRTEIYDFIASASASELDAPAAVALSERLFLLREALRERLPFCVVSPDAQDGMSIDRIMAVDDRSFWLTGWVREHDQAAIGLTAVSPEGCRVEVLENAFRHARPDVDKLYERTAVNPDGGQPDDDHKHGFVTRIQLPAPSRLRIGWMFELQGLGASVEVEGPAVLRDPIEVRDAILVNLGEQPPGSHELTLNHAYPALTRIQERLEDAAKVDTIAQHGPVNPSPDVSIIIPLYKRIDLIEFQLSQFVRDPEMERAEIVYVLDSPELADALFAMSGQLYKLYRVPFKIVVLNRNAGFSKANNLGASVARSRLLLFMNSDVIPDRPGWLGRMIGFYDSTTDIGALGPKLLFEDDSLQHAGMYFHQLPAPREGIHEYQDERSTLWENAHYFKGLHRVLPAANVTRPVPAVTGACLMIDRDLFQGLGGLRGIYVQGSYEDSDLCLRLIESGRSNWYLADVELYHLEAQSYTYPTAVRTLATKYNMWLHTHLWRKLISSLMLGPDYGLDAPLAPPGRSAEGRESVDLK